MDENRVIIAGGGIGGLTLALTLHQIGVECVVFEAVNELKPLGVGINLQPNAVRELFDLGFAAEDLDRFGVPAREWALVGMKGQDIYSEPRGLDAGYNWPQYAVHRGEFHMALYRRFTELAGSNAVRLGCRATGYAVNPDGGVTVTLQTRSGEIRETGRLLIGADGIHSAIRAQMHPTQPPIHWGGAVMWRGTSLAKPVRTGSSFMGLGTHKHRMVIYPISAADPETGLALINWIAEVTYDDPSAHETMGWFRPVGIDDFIHHFENWTYDWLDVPALIRGADIAFENPMIDRDPVPTWVDGPVALMGDAAHAMYPTGSNGASQAIIDARILGTKFLANGVGADALADYNADLCGPVSALILRNRGAGPFGLLNMVNDRCGGEFDNIEDVIPAAERAEFMAKYKAAAGFARDTLNAAPPTIAPGARVGA
ncbi:flavin-dependent oxidoreductase [Hoeflea alexandrii]|uniref:flavin-dependent oxidoreductase n=1 Tax=Hoeflea alexandrii TaxID=288436 RepID=UPI0022B07380|nr:flavin-dependent oxidoreductase [Hoeflea alexandrii]MCZ4287396.1 flavin-dependent oxidoreductase [Hoeflea alexandrii]